MKSFIGFNGGSALAANLRAAEACIVTNLAASVGGLTWMLWVQISQPSAPSNHLTFFIIEIYKYIRTIASRESGRQSDFALALSLVLWLLLRDLVSLVLVGDILFPSDYMGLLPLSPFFPHFSQRPHWCLALWREPCAILQHSSSSLQGMTIL